MSSQLPVIIVRASRGRESAGETAVALQCRAGLAFGGVLRRFAPSPPTPLPLRGRGAIRFHWPGEPRTAVRG